jgi:POT family proton-dependent oligopeptide transporter
MSSKFNHALAKENKNLQMPKGVTYIVGNELAAESGYYGMSAILIIFMTQYLFNELGDPQFTEFQAMIWYHNFIASGTIFMIAAAIIADVFWGKYRTIIIFSIIYCFGYLVLAFFNNKIGLFCGLTLISLGASGISPCVIAHLGDQFNTKNKYLLTKGYSWFYMAINLGCVPIMLITPYFLKEYGPRIAFSLSAVLMFSATIIFYRGHNFYNKVEPVGSLQKYLQDLSNSENLKAIGMVIPIFVFIAFFDALYTQIGSSWILQATKMNREINLGIIKISLEAAQVQFISPVFVVTLVLLFTGIIYPFMERFTKITNLKKIAVGFFLTTVSFAIIAIIQMLIDKGIEVSILWQFLAFFFISAAEILVIVTCNEIAYLHVSCSIKTLVAAFQLLSIGIGSLITSFINLCIENIYENSSILGANYFWTFTGLMLAVTIVFLFYMPSFKSRIYLQQLTTNLPGILGPYKTNLEQLTNIILESGKENIISIILMLPYTKKLSDKQHSWVDFLVIISDQTRKRMRQKAKDSYLSKLSDDLSDKIKKEILNAEMDLKTLIGPKYEINLKFKTLSEFNLFIDNRQQDPDFLPNLFIYNSTENGLFNFRQDEERDYYEFYLGSLKLLNIIKNITKNNCDDQFYLNFTAFCLHQIAEGFYRASLLFLTNQRSNSHNLRELNQRLSLESILFTDIFPLNEKKGKIAFKLLELSYTKSCYGSNYCITLEQIEYLITRIKKLQEITKEVCEIAEES